MDPQVAWNELLVAIATKDFFEAELRAEALIEWLDKEGFPPQTCQRLLPSGWDALICRYVCRKVMLQVNPPGG